MLSVLELQNLLWLKKQIPFEGWVCDLLNVLAVSGRHITWTARISGLRKDGAIISNLQLRGHCRARSTHVIDTKLSVS